ncbi:MAG: DUF1214 domain-containing protein [Rhodospirillaceae bacterium]|nr:MAG: DUF1214 domain-containing protein [Rhodospirillaceae bacterium]
MAFGDSPYDKALRESWYGFCEQMKSAGDRVFKQYNPANELQRADGFRFLTQALGQAFDLALETKDPRYPMIQAFCSWNRKLGGDNADCVYLQAWIDGQSAYKITGTKGSARFMNFTVQGPRPEKDAYYGANIPSLHEPFGDTPEANIFGHELKCDWDGKFVLYIGGPKRDQNWLPTTPGSRKLFLRQYFDRWEEEAALYSIERIDMDEPRPLPTQQTILESVRWAGDYLTGAMRDWPDFMMKVGVGLEDEKNINRYPAASLAGGAEQRDQRRGRSTDFMRWRLATDEALIVEFENYDGFWMFTNMGVFWNSMDYLYRPVSYTPSRTAVDGDHRVRLIMTHSDPGYQNWIDTQGFDEGYLMFRNVLSRAVPRLETKVVNVRDLEKHLPDDSKKISPEERARQMHVRFNAIRRRYRI